MSDVLNSATTALETLVEGSQDMPPLPQVLPEGQPARSGYDRAVDAVNRLPRPLAALMALALFLDAVLEPAAFASRCQVLAAMPEPLWWLTGAVLTYFFGARETHYLRHSGQAPK